MSPAAELHRWPDGLDLTLTALFLLAAFVLPATGYFFMVADYRAYLRSLRRFLAHYVAPPAGSPDWAYVQTPRCVAAFGLTLPCTEEDLMGAYRRRVKQLHPDHGGDKRRFLLTQQQFEEALQVVRQYAPPKPGAR